MIRVLRQNQAGIRPNHYCIDHLNHHKPQYLIFINFERAFDNIPHEVIRKALENVLTHLTELKYGDEICLMTQSYQDMVTQLAANKWGLKINGKAYESYALKHPILYSICYQWYAFS